METLSTKNPVEKIWGNTYKLLLGTFHLDTRKIFQKNNPPLVQFPYEVVGCPTLGTFKIQLVLSHLIQTMLYLRKV